MAIKFSVGIVAVAAVAGAAFYMSKVDPVEEIKEGLFERVGQDVKFVP